MRTPKLYHCLIIASLSCTPLAASAAPDDKQGQPRFPIDLAEVAQRQADRFARLDADGDGWVELTEFEASDFKPPHRAKRWQRRAQVNWDAKGSTDERAEPPHNAKHKAKRKAKHKEMRSAVKAEMFTLLDANQDGVLSDSEHAAQTRATRQLATKRVLFRSWDTDQDQRLSLAELPSRAERLQAADADGDGLITRTELREHRRARRSAEG